jgi:Flp pilus assembly protein CpaB
MEMEYKDPNRRGRYIVILGVVLALAAGGAAYFTINQAQQQAGQGGLQTVTIVVALKEIPARKPIEKTDVATRDVPIDETNAQGVFSDASKVIGLVPSVRILIGQPVFANLLGTGSQGGTLVILNPGEEVTATSEAWRAVSLTVPDDRAVGGLIRAGDTVDVFVTLSVLVPQSLIEAGKFYTDKSTKVTYQNLTVLAKATSFYVVKVPESLAEEISHLQASGAASFSFALRPPSDTRLVDATRLGETTSIIIQRYGLPIPVVYPSGTGGVVLPGSTLPPSPSPAPASASPSPSAP